MQLYCNSPNRTITVKHKNNCAKLTVSKLKHNNMVNTYNIYSQVVSKLKYKNN